MNNLGQFLIWVALLAVSTSSVGYAVLNVKKESATARQTARFGFIVFAAVVTIASMLLMHFILNHEFVYSYVARYSSRTLPLGYLISSFWAGQEGSFLLWVLLGSWLGVILIFKARDAEPQVMLVYNLNNIFLAILLIKQSPFQMLPISQPDGQGLNMLLQDPWMVIHPPIVFLGYAVYAIPFAYAIAGLWRKDYDGWVRPALPWTVFAFVTLGAGIIIGGYWSYKVLGWGGYWGWDPVENASLLPWLAGTALMHGMILQQTQKRLRKTNLVLAALSFILVIYCTFLTRSGVLADFSVHSFVDLGITGWLVLFMFAFIAIFIGFGIARVRDIPERQSKGGVHLISREFGLIAAMVLLTLSALVTGLGTSAPLITRMLENASKVSPEFYVNTNLPLALLMLLLVSLVPLMVWGRNDALKVLMKAKWAGAGAAIALVITLLNGYPRMDSPLLSLGVFLLSILGGAVTAMNLLLAINLARKRFRLSSGALAHLGLGLMFLGIVASTAYDRTEKVKLPQDETRTALGYELRLNQPRLTEYGKGVRLFLPLDVKKGSTAFSVQPDIYSERTRGGQPQRFVHPYIGRGLISDLYISPVDFDPGEKPRPGNEIELEKDKAATFHDYTFKFTGFDVSGMMGHQQGQREMSVGATIEVTYKETAPVTLKPVLHIGAQKTPPERVKLPGREDAFLTISRINAGAKTVTLNYEGPEPSETAAQERTLPSMIAEVSIKPGMAVLWLGCFLILFGGIVGIVRRNAK